MQEDDGGRFSAPFGASESQPFSASFPDGR
jgi:hypothetical protein